MNAAPSHTAHATGTADAVETIARTCLYEGYLLWPYRRSALKNARRWTFGGVFPRAGADAVGEPAELRTEVLFEDAPQDPEGQGAPVTVRVRFLHVVDRQLLRHGPSGPEPVDELSVDGRRHLSWQEAAEREVVLAPWTPRGSRCPAVTAWEVPAGEHEEPLIDSRGLTAGVVRRSWRRLTGTVTTEAVPLGGGVLRLTVRVENDTPCPVPEPGARGAREALAGYALVSTHLALHSGSTPFVSLMDPPERLRDAAAGCTQRGLWPVLVGEDGGDGRSATVLASPVTLYDFPAVAPESPGDLFDGTEIDQLLILSVLGLSEREQEEARASDPRAREILDRCAALSPEELMALHGTIRSRRPLREGV